MATIRLSENFVNDVLAHFLINDVVALNIYPLEIESYLNAYPGINTSAIIEVPAEIWGEVGYAFVVPEESVDLDIEEIKKYCKEGLTDYKQPRKIIIKKDIPRTLIGKIAKQEIRKDIKKYIDI